MLLAAAGLLGAAGVALGAASAHLGGGDLSRLGSAFLLFHAAAVPGLLALPWPARRLVRLATTCLALGAALFSGDVALLGFTGRTPVAGLAPAGGILLMIGWLLVAVSAASTLRVDVADS
jgi:uncharacterized membrane protein YgdD (TMEM256/DUF423 family)